MKYRPEIDGLRAIAVIPIILFHAGFETFSGGFIGVDIFFVISGYLITNVINSELDQDRFSIINFYERRARRILPALFLLMLVSIPFAWFWLLPLEMKYYSQSLVAVSLFASNILFWLQTGYFDPSSDLKPLLHTWSLGVEEQFYLFFPIILIFLRKSGSRWTFSSLTLILILSLGIAEWASYAFPSASFYLLLARVFELLIGSFAAFYLQQSNQISFNKSIREFTSLLGIILIAYATFFFNKETPFPSFYALVPALGTVLIILFSTQETAVGKFIGNKAFVSIGLLSYSAYLYHQPLFAFARHRIIFEPTKTTFIFLSSFVFILAYLSWYFVESPFRNKEKFNRISIFTGSIFITIFFISFGLFGHLSNGFENYRLKDLKQVYTIPDLGTSLCHRKWLRNVNELKNEDFCTLGIGDPTIAIIGDSHAGVLFTYADEYFKSMSISALAVTGELCAPLINGFELSKHCKEVMSAAFKKIIDNPKIKTVILVARWNIYETGLSDKKKSSLQDNEGRATTPNENITIFRRSLYKTLEILEKNNKKIVIVYNVPEFDMHAYNFIRKQHLFNDVPIATAAGMLPKITIQKYHTQNYGVFSVFNEVKDRVRFFEVERIFCPEQVCEQSSNGLPLYSDTNHLNMIGAKMLVPELFNFILSKSVEK